MKPYLVAAALLALTGCAGMKMGHARDAGAIASLDSARPAADLAQCVEVTWASQSLFGAEADAFTERSGKGLYTVSDHASDYFADITASGAGSQVKFYGNPRSGDQARKRQATLATCL
ncbi:hypothetical protein [Pseudomonas sp. NPDC007930]|uniref:hypothetical protein n=1 Tax=Pseudomonas sp. NPDC007930 TaxID=3364417 RepID=UPI0036E61469